jgi:O-antigen ligase
MNDVGIDIWIAVGICAVIGHALLFILSQRVNSCSVLAAAFLLLSPFSLSYESGFGVKLLRIYVTVLLMLLAIRMSIGRGQRLSAGAKMFLVFVIFYFLGSFWCGEPTESVKYKGLFLLLEIGAVFWGAAVQSPRELLSIVRFMLVPIIGWCFAIGINVVMHPENVGRLQSFGMNPNSIAASSAFNLVLCLYILFFDRSAFLRPIAMACAVANVLILPLTGSRGGIGCAALATAVLAVPLVKRPSLLLLAACVMGITVYFGADLLPASTLERFGDFSTATRQSVWLNSYQLISDAPIFGHGWVYNTVTGAIATANQHSIYLQVLVETGLVGLTLMLMSLLIVLWQSWQTLHQTKLWQLPVAPIYLGFALLSCVVSGGAFEAGPMVGTTINALFFGFSIGLLGAARPMLDLAQQEEENYPPVEEYTEEYFAEDVF